MSEIEEYLNISSNCFCQKCSKKIKIKEFVYKLNDDWVNVCEKCKEDIIAFEEQFPEKEGY